MFVAALIVSIALATALAVSAARKLTHAPDVVEGYARAGVPAARLNQLAAVLFASAAGLLVGLWWSPLGVAAAVGLSCYFLVAVAFHIRAGDLANLPMPVALAVVAALAAAFGSRRHDHQSACPVGHRGARRWGRATTPALPRPRGSTYRR